MYSYVMLTNFFYFTARKLKLKTVMIW